MRKTLYSILNMFYWSTLISSAVFGVVGKIDPVILAGHADGLVPLLVWLKSLSWMLILTSVLAAVFAVLRSNISAPWVKVAVKHILDAMRDHAFEHVDSAANFHHRVTLFRHVKGPCWRALVSRRWPFGGWVVPFARSGHLTQNITVCFRVPDAGDDAEGIAGQTFAQDLTLQVEGLPDVSNSNCSNGALKDYARRTFVDPKWLQKERSTARSLIGIPVKVKGEPWGAIVVDSRASDIPDRDNVVQAYVLIAKVLGEVLERS